MTAEEKAGQNSSPPEADWSAAEIAEMEVRADKAKQALTGMIFAALKMRGRKLRATPESLPLTVISGFLGSGKTTLLNHLLVSPHGRRLVVLVNDFGRINIDVALVSSQTDDMISLANGCACCAISSELTNVLIAIAEREDPPDAIVLEASGIADPAGIVQAALTNPAIRFDGNLVVVDAVTLQTLAEAPVTSRMFRNQISAADLIVLSKVDLLDDGKLAEARRWLADRYQDKRVIEAVNGDVPPGFILGIDTKRDLPARDSEPTNHAHEFESWSFTVDGPLNGERLQELFDSLPKALLRAKGVLYLAEEPKRRIVYQRVGERWSYRTAEPWGAETPRSSLVFIGPRGLLDQSTLEASLNSCVAERQEQ